MNSKDRKGFVVIQKSYFDKPLQDEFVICPVCKKLSRGSGEKCDDCNAQECHVVAGKN